MERLIPNIKRLSKHLSLLIIIALVIFTGVTGFLGSKLEFDYDFEHFFPQNDEDLDFFLEYRETFENDNDYILISVGNQKGIFDSQFLQKANRFAIDLEQLNHVEEVISPTNIKQPILNTFGYIEIPLLHINDPSKFKNDSIRISKSKEYTKTLFSSDYKSICIVVHNAQIITKKASDELLIDIESLISKYDFKELHFAGKIRGQKTYLTKMKFELILFLSISIILIITFLFISFKSIYGVIIPLITVFIAITGVLGIMQHLGKSLDVMSTLLPTILFVVGMSDAVHILNRYIEELRSGNKKIDAIKITFKEVGLATFFTSLTTAVGFITLMMVPIRPMQDFGMYSAIGVILAFIIAITFLPATLSLLKKPKISNINPKELFWNKVLSKSFLFVIRNQGKIVIGYCIVVILSIIGIFQLEVDYKLLEDLSEDNPLQQDFRYFENNYSGIRPFEMAIYTKDSSSIFNYETMLEMNKVENYLYDDYEAGFILSPVSIIKSVNKAVHGGNSNHYNIPNSEKKYKALLKKIERANLKDKLRHFINETNSVARFTGKMDDIGSKKVKEINILFEQFFQSKIDNNLIGYKMTGTALLVDKNNEFLATNMIMGLAIAFLLIAILIGFIFKSIKMAFLSIIPNVIPLAFIGGLMGYLGTNINMSTSIIFTIAFGIAVDDTIHFLSKFKIENSKGKSLIYSLERTYLSTGKAIVLTTLILCGGFMALIFSDFKSTFLIGAYVSLILFVAVITDLLLLPVLLMNLKKKK
ncbi:MAG: MMPL family transporter [Flavobacteriales bacterium]|nr:MMPL family transporter [Flavobacteriales bacterium]